MNPAAAASLFAMIAHSPDLAGAVCVDPAARELFDDAAGVHSAGAVEQALWACGRCPALRACRAWVEGLPAGRRPRGVVGGLVITDRTGRSAVPRRVRLPS